MFLLLKSCISTLILICYILMYNVIVLPGSRGHYYLLSHPWHTCYSPIPWKQLDIIQPNFHKFFCKTWCLTCYFCPAWFFGGVSHSTYTYIIWRQQVMKFFLGRQIHFIHTCLNLLLFRTLPEKRKDHDHWYFV